jgi:hypothetical protein
MTIDYYNPQQPRPVKKLILAIFATILGAMIYSWVSTWVTYSILPIGSSFRDMRIDLCGLNAACLLFGFAMAVRLATTNGIRPCLLVLGITVLGIALSVFGTASIMSYLISTRKLKPLP